MKIIILSSLAFSLVNFRGALLRKMRALGHDVLAVAPDDDPQAAGWLADNGIDFTTISMNRTGLNPLQDVQTLMAYVSLMVREKPDMVLAYTQKPIIYGGIAARIAGNIPYFAMMSGLGYLFSPDGAKPGLVRTAFLRLYRAAVRNARKVFVFNSDDHGDMLASGIVSKKHQVIQVPGSGVETHHFAYQPILEGAPHFLMVGRLMRDKGVFEFLNAARRVSKEFPQVRFSILGRAESLNPTGISEEDIAALQDEFPVEFLPETKDVRPHLAQSTVFVLPSYYREGLPRTILEAMSTGRAVITTDMPGCRDPIDDGKNGILIPPRDVDALAAAMRSFVIAPHRAAEMGAHSRAIAERVYDVAKVNAMLIDHMGLDRTTVPRNAPQTDAVHQVSTAGRL